MKKSKNFSAFGAKRIVLKKCFQIVKTGDKMADKKIAHITSMENYENMFWDVAAITVRAFKFWMVDKNITRKKLYDRLDIDWRKNFKMSISKWAFYKVLRDINTPDLSKAKRMVVIFSIMKLAMGNREIYQVIERDPKAEGKMKLVKIIYRNLNE